MRFSTIGLVVAVVSAAAYGYGSMFQLAGPTSNEQAGPGAWPTFLDSARVIKAEPPATLKAKLPAAARPASQNVAVATSTAKVVASAEHHIGVGAVAASPASGLTDSANLTRISSTSVPPLPELAPPRKLRASARLNPLAPPRRLSAVVVELPQQRRRETPARPTNARTAEIVTGSIPNRIARISAAAKFAKISRSSLGGPMPVPVENSANSARSGRTIATLPPSIEIKSSQNKARHSVAAIEVSVPSASPFRTSSRRIALLPQRQRAVSKPRKLTHRLPPLLHPRRSAVYRPGETTIRRQFPQPTRRLLSKKRVAALSAPRRPGIAKAKRARRAAVANRKARARRAAVVNRKARARRMAQKRKAQRRRQQRIAARRARRVGRPRHVRRFRSYREFQAYRNRVIANQIRRRRWYQRSIY